MILAIYNCIWTPLTVSFDWAIMMGKTTEFLIIENSIMIVYILDIVVQFLTSYYNVQTGDEINKPKMIAKKYIRGEFVIDFLSTFPFRYFNVDSGVYHTITKICSLLKVLRIRKLYSTIS